MSTDATPGAAPVATPQAQFKQAHALSRKMIGEVMQIPEPSIGKMEKQIDMYLSMLRSHIEAMGGTFEVSVNMPAGRLNISSLSDPQ